MEFSHTTAPRLTSRLLLLPKDGMRKIAPNMSYGHKNVSLISLRNPENSFPKISNRLSYDRNMFPLIKATADRNEAEKSFSPIKKASNFSNVLLRFLRPHVLYGRTIGWIAIMTRVWMDSAHLVTSPKWVLFLKAAAALVAIMCATSFVSSINQIYDIEIDRVNKPFHPLVSGELSLESAWMMVIGFVATGTAISLLLKSYPLLAHVVCTVILGLLYSVPPFSLKKSSVGAVIINAMLGFSFVLSTSLTARTILGLPLQLSMPVIFMTSFDTQFKIASGVLKDIHDLEGDMKFNIPTLASIYGAKKVAHFGFTTMIMNYVGAIVSAILMPQAFNRSVMIPIHVILAAYYAFQAWKLEKANYTKEASQSFYGITWKLLYLEYILFPFM